MPILRLLQSVPAWHGEGDINLLLSNNSTSNSISCPGLFYQTPAKDGKLYRLRTPGGIITGQQFNFVASLAEEFGNGYLHITNRGNLQLRQINHLLSADILNKLQEIGIASNLPEVDHLRNIMGSPTAGIDVDELIDVIPLIRQLDDYICSHPHWAPLSPKFSVCFDGGGLLSVGDRPNDIIFSPIKIDDFVYFCVKLYSGGSFIDLGIILKPQQSIEFVAAIANVYLKYLSVEMEPIKVNRKSSQPRLRDIFKYLGLEKFIQEIGNFIGFSLEEFGTAKKGRTRSFERVESHQDNYQHIGVHPQRQVGLSYIGVVVPLGKLESWQVKELTNICQAYGNGILRLTPWQNLIISDIPNQYIEEVKNMLEKNKLHWSTNNIRSSLVACAGITGCSSSHTDTQNHALLLAEYLDKNITLDQPMNIHFTGCSKSCAQHYKSDITLLGVSEDNQGIKQEGYHIYVGSYRDEYVDNYGGDENGKFGRQIYQWVTFTEIFPLLKNLLEIYMEKRTTPHESFGDFVNQYQIHDLQKIFNKISQKFPKNKIMSKNIKQYSGENSTNPNRIGG
jgi:ferredoxin-nitrite reductase